MCTEERTFFLDTAAQTVHRFGKLLISYVERSWPSNVLTICNSLLKAGSKQSELRFGHHSGGLLQVRHKTQTKAFLFYLLTACTI